VTVGRIGAGKAAVIRMLAAELISKVRNGTATIDDIGPSVDALAKRINNGGTLASLPRVEDGAFVRREDISDMIAAANLSYAYLTAEADTLEIVTKMIAYLANGRIDSAEAAVTTAADLVGNLQTYTKIRRGGANGIVVDLRNVSGNCQFESGVLISQIKSSRSIKPQVVGVRTNGRPGNLIELNGNITLNTPLESYEISFVDPMGDRSRESALDDNDPSTIYEVEAIRINPSVLTASYIETPIRIPVEGGYEDIVVNQPPANNELWAEITIIVPNDSSMLQLIPALINSQKIIVDSILVSSDGTDYKEIVRDFTITPETNAFVDEGGTNAGTGLFFLPSTKVNYIVLRLKTHDAYITKFAHATERNADGYVVPSAYDASTTKAGYFSPQTTSSSGETRLREVVAIPGVRWSIPIRSLMLTKNEYESTSSFETETYRLASPCERVAISAVEDIPDGTSIQYEITHDDGRTWTPITPVERFGGKEIIVFGADTTGNPNSAQTTYVAVTSPVTSLRVRATYHSIVTATPALRNLTIQPMTSGN
jgi:hypothetical protein